MKVCLKWGRRQGMILISPLIGLASRLRQASRASQVCNLSSPRSRQSFRIESIEETIFAMLLLAGGVFFASIFNWSWPASLCNESPY